MMEEHSLASRQEEVILASLLMMDLVFLRSSRAEDLRFEEMLMRIDSMDFWSSLT